MPQSEMDRSFTLGGKGGDLLSTCYSEMQRDRTYRTWRLLPAATVLITSRRRPIGRPSRSCVREGDLGGETSMSRLMQVKVNFSCE